VLRVRYTPPGEANSGRYALFHAAVGLVSEVTAIANRYKGRLGLLGYAAGAVVDVLRHRARTIHCSCDGGPLRSRSLDLIFAANSRYAGGGRLFAPMASMEDGMLDLLSVEGAPKRFIVLRLLSDVYRGAHLRHAAVTHVRARSIHLAVDEPLPVEMDGERAGTTPVWIDVLPRALPVCL
jgi:diacylglycerol kinase family enzyme